MQKRRVKDVLRNKKGQFQKGHIPWNNNTKGLCKTNEGSFKKGEHRNTATEFKEGKLKGQNNNKWAGNNVGYFALHTWLTREFGKPTKCERCGSMKDVQWASKNYKYSRLREDWIHLCYKCHRNFDKNHWGLATKKFNLRGNNGR